MAEKESIAGSLELSTDEQGDRSFGESAGKAFEGVPIVGKGYKTIADSAKQFNGADDFGDFAGATGEMVSNGASFVAGCAADVAAFAMDPVGWLVSNGLDFLLELIQPLQDALHFVTGDGPSLEEASGNFIQIGDGFVSLAQDFIATGDKALKDWGEDAGDAAREALADFAVGIEGIGSSAGGVSQTLKMWSMVMTVIEEVIKAIISELVSWLIYIWLPALAASIVSLGSSVGAAMAASVAKAASVFSKVTSKLGKLGKLLDEFMVFLQKFSSKLVKANGRLTKGQENAAVGALSSALVGRGRATAMAAGDVLKGSGKTVLEESVKEVTGFKPEQPGSAADLAKSGLDAKDKVGEYAETARAGEIGGGQDADETRENLEM
ncbi:MAG: hypothetical protein GEU86_02600 [Actinophytocola sp.]|nr:hypothetical protein [Actinophytocola sp.]